MSSTDTASAAAEKKKVTLKSSDGETFDVDIDVASESQTIKHSIEDDETSAIPLPNVTGSILAKVIEYCKKHVESGGSEDKAVVDGLKEWDAEFMKIDQNTLFDLILAANYLNIKGLLDLTCQTVADMKEKQVVVEEEGDEEEEEELRTLLVADVSQLPASPPSIVEINFERYFAPDFMKAGHDQYIYRHANGLCVIGLAPSHVALQENGGVTSIDFNVGKSDRSELKVTGKRKKNAQQFESNTALCKVICGETSYVIRCCVKGSLLEVNNRLMESPDLLNTSADRDGYIAIIQPKAGDWLKAKQSLLDLEGYRKLRALG